MQKQVDKREAAQMFDRISSTYDFLNRFFSVGIDRIWRRGAVRRLNPQPGERILDCSSGTGDMAFTVGNYEPEASVCLYDPAMKMLEIARRKATPRFGHFSYVQGTAESIPFPDESFDHFMVAFGIRNFTDLTSGLAELYRILRPGGTGVILEFTPDRSGLIDRVFRIYMWGVMRPVGGLISRDKDAYAYLAKTVECFPVIEELERLYRNVGFREVESKPLSLGIASRFHLTK